ncbi:Flp family type IVb pilin [Filobacillus milosensis]|uniref:Flp family type IVb pilin n=1 Tax=Filobacillus milosensis TaxID=94137 RepID=A0A4Y8IR28_9BACI|nr:Flp family type IVb pilin [Filobacillus milosensis]TFB24038.1 Flp family type IVb pilin [Filobacillus milosensis]
MMKKFLELLREEDGQNTVEYGLIIGLVSVVAITIIISVGRGI